MNNLKFLKMQRIKILFAVVFLAFFSMNSYAFNPVKNIEPVKQSPDSNKKSSIQNTPNVSVDTAIAKIQKDLPIDTAPGKMPLQTIVQTDTIKKLDSILIPPVTEENMTNTRLFIYILLSVIGLGLFFFIFVINLFKTFHKKKSTRQSLLLSWTLFFIVTIVWVFIIWGLVAGFWTSASFMIVVIFLFIISLIMTIIAIKSK